MWSESTQGSALASAPQAGGDDCRVGLVTLSEQSKLSCNRGSLVNLRGRKYMPVSAQMSQCSYHGQRARAVVKQIVVAPD